MALQSQRGMTDKADLVHKHGGSHFITHIAEKRSHIAPHVVLSLFRQRRNMTFAKKKNKTKRHVQKHLEDGVLREAGEFQMRNITCAQMVGKSRATQRPGSGSKC